MSTPYVTHRRTPLLAGPHLAASVLLILAFLAGEARAQYRVDQGGYLFDANPQLGGDRYNPYVRPVSPLVGGNPFATGNVGRGFSLRSFSPISASTDLRAALGTTSLSNFIRDSVSVADQAGPLGGLAPRAFFDPARTAPTGSYLRGFYDSQPVYPARLPTWKGSAAVGPTTPFDGALQYGSPPGRRAELERVTRAPYESVGAPLNTELSSAIFGLEPPRLGGLLSDAALQSRSPYLPGVRPYEFGSEGSRVGAAGIQEPLDLRVWPTLPTESVPTPLDVVMQEDAARLLAERPVPTFLEADETVGVADIGDRPGEAAAADTIPGEPTELAAAALLGSNDVFTDMQLALDLALARQAEWYTEMLDAAPESLTEVVELSPEMQARAAAQEFLTRVLELPLQTFAGEGASAVNDELREAETAMELGRYYDAIRHYERVRRLDAANPLPLIGKGHALLAAGEYVSAALSLTRGLERFPQMARFEVDLVALVGGGEIVDIRRADLMKQLARNENAQLRFLLGYLEIHTGQRELGLENLDRAAREAEPGSLIRRYPDMIRQKGMLPAPRPLPGESPDSTIDGSHLPGSHQSSPGKEPE